MTETSDLLAIYPRFKTFLAVDLEGNGASPPEAIEIAAVHFCELALKNVQSWRIKPEQAITQFARRIHGISNKDVEHAPQFCDVAVDVERTLNDKILVIHNAHVDLDVLTRQLPHWRPAQVVDTLKLARALFPELASHALQALITHFQLEETTHLGDYGKSHNATYDAVGAGLVLIECLERAQSRKLNENVVFDQGAHKREAVQTRNHGSTLNRQNDLFGWSQSQTRR
jgi:DNA polymerase III epsilon subunit family exonuclease